MTVYDNIKSNNIKTFLLLFSYPLVLGVIIYLISYIVIIKFMFPFFTETPAITTLTRDYASLVTIVILIVTILIFGSICFYSIFYFFKNNDKGLVVLNQDYIDKYKDVIRIVQKISITAGIRCPRVVVHYSKAMNAYATGTNPNNSVVVLTAGLLNNLSEQELEAVIAHEIAHIANRDTKLMMAFIMQIIMLEQLRALILSEDNCFLNVFVSFILLATLIIPLIILLLSITTFLLSPIFKFAISRKREFIADSTAVLYTRNPGALMEALIVISSGSEVKEFQATEIAALCISAPSSKPNFIQKIFHTHPPMDERIEAIMKSSYIVKS